MKKAILFIILITSLSCGKSTDDANSSIVVMVPDWAVPSDEMLDKFTEETSIEVIMNIVSWDDIREKIAIAATAGNAVADVVEVDWSWVGEFYSADWLLPIEVSKEEIDAMPSLSSFIVDDKVLAIPYANDFRIAYYNKEHFEKANIEAQPVNWNQVYENAKTIKLAGIVEYPLSMPLSASEPTTTALIWLALAKYGVVFNDDKTLNKDAILGSLEFINQIVNEDKLIDPANTTSSGMDTYRKITSGEASFIVGPTSFVSRVNDEKESQVIGKVTSILLPGSETASLQTMALPEGLGVLKLSKNQEAATKFVEWFTSKEIQNEMNYVQNTIPTRTDVLEELISIEKLKETGALLEQSMKITSPFPGGVPNYYSEMSNIIFNAVNEMALGRITPEQAFENMDTKIKVLIKN